MKPRAANPPVDIDVTRERLVKLGLLHASEQLATWLGLRHHLGRHRHP